VSNIGRVVGLDIGEARTGVALSDPLQVVATPHSTIAMNGGKADIAALARAVAEADARIVVVGLPLNQYGEMGPQAEKVKVVAAALAKASGATIEYQDERFSSAEAERHLRSTNVKSKKRKQVIDQVAAAHILQTWLDRQAAERRRNG
jgi:putative Holliday junction resolvase